MWNKKLHQAFMISTAQHETGLPQFYSLLSTDCLHKIVPHPAFQDNVPQWNER